MLVIITDAQDFHWFGSGLGKAFGNEKMDFFLEFLKFCQGMYKKNKKQRQMESSILYLI